jgi:hypothetical protein
LREKKLDCKFFEKSTLEVDPAFYRVVSLEIFLAVDSAIKRLSERERSRVEGGC